MKVRKLAVALALAGGLGSGVAQALGLGEIELQSFLNEPLDADISLRKSQGVSPDDVFVNIAPQSAYERVGIDRSFFLTKLNFQVTTAPDGSLVVNVSSREPLREPYLNFLVEVTWPNGRLMREYAVLVDPPVYAEESGVEEQVSAPATSQATQPRQQQQSRQQAPASRSASQPQPSGSRTLGPTTSSDTLWTLAAQVRPNRDVTMQQVMLALQDLNPDAFMDGNINRLKRGEILRVPDESQIRSRSRAAANQEVAIQNRDFSTPARTVDATGDTADAASGEAAGSGGGDQLRLVAADETDSRDATDGGSAGGDGDTAGGVDAGTAVAMEELESARRENEELTGRVDDLQEQVETLQRLLELKNTQLADMQSAQGESPEDPTVAAGDDPSAEQEPSAGQEPSGEQELAAGEEPSAGQEPSAGEEPSAEQADATAPADAGTEEAPEEQPEMAEDQAASDEQQEMAADQQASEAMEEDAGAESEQEVASEAPAAADQPAPAQKPFPGNIIDAISNNFMYQVALGGGLILLLLLLLLLARRNANREKAFYDQLNSETEGDETDSFDLTFDEDDEVEGPKDDAIAEADAYIAYGRNDQAAQTLETAISREPSRTDLRLKLLGVYAEIQDRESFDKQFREIEALDDEAATAEAVSLQNRLEEAESMPSIDDLESQLRSGGYDQDEDEPEVTGSSSDDIEFPESDVADGKAAAEVREDDEPDFEDLDLDLPDADADDELPETFASEDANIKTPEESDSDDKSDDEPDEGSGEDRDDLIEYDLSSLETDDEDLSESDELELSDDLDDTDESFEYSLEDLESDSEETEDDDELSLDFETPDSEADKDDLAETPKTSEQKEESEEPEMPGLDSETDDELDESFLDELDAELDKVAGEDESLEDEDESDLDDLELDVSDEDLALMEEFSETDDASASDNPEKAESPDSSEDEDLSLDDELGLEDAFKGDEPADPELEVEGAEQADEKLSEEKPAEDEGEDSDDDALVPPVASDSRSGSQSDEDIDESDLGDDDDFDFLTGTDEAATKLDLARAYVEMGDVDGARDILEEVALEGNDEQKAEAQDLLKNLS